MTYRLKIDVLRDLDQLIKNAVKLTMHIRHFQNVETVTRLQRNATKKSPHSAYF